MKKILRLFYLYSNYIVNYSFFVYFFIYIVGKLNEKHIAYSFILFALLGLYLGYKFAMAAIDYLKKNP